MSIFPVGKRLSITYTLKELRFLPCVCHIYIHPRQRVLLQYFHKIHAMAVYDHFDHRSFPHSCKFISHSCKLYIGWVVTSLLNKLDSYWFYWYPIPNSTKTTGLHSACSVCPLFFLKNVIAWKLPVHWWSISNDKNVGKNFRRDIM